MMPGSVVFQPTTIEKLGYNLHYFHIKEIEGNYNR
jgi:hypothetical protein